jgi:hypothetical protein
VGARLPKLRAYINVIDDESSIMGVETLICLVDAVAGPAIFAVRNNLLQNGG